MRKRIKKVLATWLAVALVLGMFPTTALEALAATVKSGYEILVSPTLVCDEVYRKVENHRLSFTNNNGKEGLIDINNNVIIPFVYDRVNLSANGKFAIVLKGEKFGVCDATTGKAIYDCKYNWVNVVDSNRIIIWNSDESAGLYDENGKAIISTKYSSIYSMGTGYFKVCKNNKYGVITRDGTLVYDCVYSDVKAVGDDSKILLKSNDGVWRLCDLDDNDFVVTLGAYDSVYESEGGFTAYHSVDGINGWIRFSYEGTPIKVASFECYEWGKTFFNNEKQELLYLYDDDSRILNIYNYSLEKVKTYSDVDSFFGTCMFSREGIYYTFNGENEICVFDGKECSYDYVTYDLDFPYIIVKMSENEQKIFATNGEIGTFTGDIWNIYSYVNDCVVIEYSNRYEVADYTGRLIEALDKSEGEYDDLPNSGADNFFVKNYGTEKWLYGIGGKKICKIGLANDSIDDMTSDGDVNYYVKNETQKRLYIFDENQNHITTVGNCDFPTEVDDAYIIIHNNENNEETNSIIGLDGTVYFDSAIHKYTYEVEKGRWLSETHDGVWGLYNSKFEKIVSFGKCNGVEYNWRTKIYECGTYGDDSYEKLGVYSETYGWLMPMNSSYADYFYDADTNSTVALTTKNMAVAFDGKGIQLCTMPNVKELVSYHDGYLVYKSTNNNYGIYKVTKVGHTHKTNSYNGKDATTSKNGYTSYKKCTICGDVTGKTTIYAASKVSASSKNYNGKTQSVSLSVKDSKGKTISKSYYSVSGTTKAKKVGSYKVKITFKGKYTGSKTITWKINPTKTKFTKATAGKKKITLKWGKKTTEVTGYKIQYSTDKNFKKGVKTVTIKKNKTTSKTISKLKSKKKYYVRICTYKGSYTSGWSSAKAVTVK